MSVSNNFEGFPFRKKPSLNEKSYNEKKDFNQYYQQHIIQHIKKFEGIRLEKLHDFISRLKIVLAIEFIIISASLYFLYFGSKIQDIALIAFILTLGLVWWVCQPIVTYKPSIKKEIFPHIFEFFGGDFIYKLESPLSVYSLKESEIIPSFDNEDTEDYVKGSYSGVQIELMEATLTKERPIIRRFGSGFNSNSINILSSILLLYMLFKFLKNVLYKQKSFKHFSDDNEIVFNGMLIRLNMNKNFLYKTIIKKDSGLILNWINDKTNSFKNLENVQLEDPIFEKQFEVYSENQVEARYLLTTSFMERLLKLTELFKTSDIQCSFYNNTLLLMIPCQEDRFEPKSIFYPVDFQEDMKSIISEMNIIFEMIEILKLNQKIGM